MTRRDEIEAYWESTNTVSLLDSNLRMLEESTVLRYLHRNMDFADLGFRIYATRGTHEHLQRIGVESTPVRKISEGGENIIDLIRSGEVHLVLNTLSPDRNPEREGARIRRASVEHAIPCLTSLDTARALLFALSGRQKGGDYTYLAIQDYVAISAEG